MSALDMALDDVIKSKGSGGGSTGAGGGGGNSKRGRGGIRRGGGAAGGGDKAQISEEVAPRPKQGNKANGVLAGAVKAAAAAAKAAAMAASKPAAASKTAGKAGEISKLPKSASEAIPPVKGTTAKLGMALDDVIKVQGKKREKAATAPKEKAGGRSAGLKQKTRQVLKLGKMGSAQARVISEALGVRERGRRGGRDERFAAPGVHPLDPAANEPQAKAGGRAPMRGRGASSFLEDAWEEGYRKARAVAREGSGAGRFGSDRGPLGATRRVEYGPASAARMSLLDDWGPRGGKGKSKGYLGDDGWGMAWGKGGGKGWGELDAWGGSSGSYAPERLSWDRPPPGGGGMRSETADGPWQSATLGRASAAAASAQRRSSGATSAAAERSTPLRTERATRVERPAEKAPAKKTVRVSNVPKNLDHRDIKEAFEDLGKVLRCEVERGVAIITFETAAEAKKAVTTFDRGELNGQTIYVAYESN